MPLPKKPKTVEEWEALVMMFIGSLSLADHMGDASNDIADVLEILGHEPEFNEYDDLSKWLGKRGVTTLHGTKLTGK